MKNSIILSACTIMLILTACGDDKKDESKSGEQTTSAATEKDKVPPAAEIADAKYAQMGQKMAEQLASGDIEGWGSNYADNAMFRWSSGDSLAGKAAIMKYWTDRRKNVIDSIKFSNYVWLPMKINKPQTDFDSKGVWLLSWYQVNVKYKTGKPLMFWVHIDHHFDANDKIDRTIQYIDMAPIKEALSKK